MKVYLFNDRWQKIVVRIGANKFKPLFPAKGEVFEIDAPEGTIPFVKIWEDNTVLISYVSEDSVKGT